MKYSVFLKISLVWFLCGCSNDETVAAYGAAGKTWRVVEIDDVPFDADATLNIAKGGNLSGVGPCNAYSAAMSTPYPWFEAGPILATNSHCPQIEAERAYFSALTQMSLSEVLGNVLILSTAEGRSIILKADA